MAADSDPESEVFEITDFTTASEWERFVSRVEEVLNDWKLIGKSPGKLSLEKSVRQLCWCLCMNDTRILEWGVGW
uniref:RAB3 GTPase activating protein subunit 1 n=1 Tax=Lates calcarifer TaxID=8187 RepID=A0A4W6EGH0_LATCA